MKYTWIWLRCECTLLKYLYFYHSTYNYNIIQEQKNLGIILTKLRRGFQYLTVIVYTSFLVVLRFVALHCCVSSNFFLFHI